MSVEDAVYRSTYSSVVAFGLSSCINWKSGVRREVPDEDAAWPFTGKDDCRGAMDCDTGAEHFFGKGGESGGEGAKLGVFSDTLTEAAESEASARAELRPMQLRRIVEIGVMWTS